VTEFLVALAAGALAVAIAPILGSRSAGRRDRTAHVMAALPPIASLCLFYSLALHMHQRLGEWPRVIGDRGFPVDLVMHADVALFTFGSVVAGFLFVCPVAALLCAAVPRLRSSLRYVGIYAMTCGVAFALMQLAPNPFLAWWWD
jgi:hypothetical protein